MSRKSLGFFVTMVFVSAVLSVVAGCQTNGPSSSSSSSSSSTPTTYVTNGTNVLLSTNILTNYAGNTFPDSVYFITTNSTEIDFQASFYGCITNVANAGSFDAANGLVQLVPATNNTGSFYLIFPRATGVTTAGYRLMSF